MNSTAQKNALPSADIFTKISDTSEKANLFSSLSKTRGKLVAKTNNPEDELSELMAFDFHNGILSCQHRSGKKLKDQGEIILQFLLGTDKYFMTCNYRTRTDFVEIYTDTILYHLQRRQDYRLNIPMSFSAIFEIVSVNGTAKKHSYRIQDLSGGGCRVEIPVQSSTFKVQDKLKGHLFLLDREPIVVEGIIRHIRMDAPKKNWICGIQFMGLSSPQKNRIIALVMDLYRQFFAGRV